MAFQFQDKDIELLIDGREAFPRIIERIRSAKKSIDINMYIWRDDKIGNEIAKELLNAANRGVKISIFKEPLGSILEKSEENKQSFFHKEKRFYLWVRQILPDYFYYTPGEAKTSKQKFNNLVNSLMGNKNITVEKGSIKKEHSKYYIFDDDIIIFGSVNIEDKEINPDTSGTIWNGYMIELKGKEIVNRFKARTSGQIDFNSDLLFDFLVNRENGQRFEIKPKIMELLSTAKEKVYIEMPYFGDKEIMDKIIETSKRGVEIIIICPRIINFLTDLNLKTMRNILDKTQRKATVFLCKNKVHGKVVNIDERFTLLGSANLDKQSMNNFDELDILINGKKLYFTKKLIQNLKKHIDISVKITDPSQIKFNRLKAFFEDILAR